MTSRILSSAVLLLAMVGCYSSESTKWVTIPRDAALMGMGISLDTAHVELSQGRTASINAAIQLEHYRGPLVLSATGLPAGVTMTTSPEVITGRLSNIALQLSATSTATTGSSTVTLELSGPGKSVAEAHATFELVVERTGIDVALADSALTVMQGEAGALSITVTRSHFTGLVDLAATGLPDGIAATFNPASLVDPATNSIVTISADAAAIPGTSTVTIQASSSVGVASKTFALTVVEAPVTTAISLDFCASVIDAPLWMAYRNTGGDWQRVVPDANGTFTFSATDAFGLAMTKFVTATRTTTSVQYLTVAELQTVNGRPCIQNEATGRSLSGTMTGVSGIGVFGRAHLRGNFATVSSTQLQPFAFTLGVLPTTPVDMVAVRGTSTGNSTTMVMDKVILRRDLATPSGGSIGLIDFNGPDAVLPDVANYSVTGLVGGETNSISARFWSNALGPDVSTTLISWGPATFAASGTYTAIPSSLTLDGDIHDMTASASATINSTTFSVRNVLKAYRVASALTFALGPAINAPTVTQLTVAQPIRYRALLSSQSEYAATATLTATQLQRNTFSVQVSSAYLGAVPAAWDLSIPDLRGVDGWNPAWELVPGVSVSLATSAASATAPIYSDRQAWLDGTTLRSALRRVLGLIP